jgi:hypothetical protein
MADPFDAIYNPDQTATPTGSKSGSDVENVDRKMPDSGSSLWADLAAGAIAAGAVVASVASYGAAAPEATEGAVAADTALVGGTAAAAGATDVGAGAAAADVGATAADTGVAADTGATAADVGTEAATAAPEAISGGSDFVAPTSNAFDAVYGTGTTAPINTASIPGQTTIDEATTAGANGPSDSSSIGNNIKNFQKAMSAGEKVQSAITKPFQTQSNPNVQSTFNADPKTNASPSTIGGISAINTPTEGADPTLAGPSPAFTAIFGNSPLAPPTTNISPQLNSLPAITPLPALNNQTLSNQMVTSDRTYKTNIQSAKRDIFTFLSSLQGKH